MTTARKTRAPAIRPHSERGGGLAVCRAVEVFAEGEHNDKRYTAKDLDEIVENFAQFSAGPQALVKPPLSIGHEDEQPLVAGTEAEYRDNTGIPGFGRVAKLWAEKRDGKRVVLADFADVPKSIARLINGRAYTKVSAEIYDEPPEGVPGNGKMLRRVALLGGELPQVKTLADLPLADYSEYPSTPVTKTTLRIKDIKPGQRAGTFRIFSEVKMDRAQLEQQAAQVGLSEDAIKMLDDTALAKVVMDLLAKQGGTPAPAPTEELAETPAATTPQAAPSVPNQQPTQVVLKYSELAGLLKPLVEAAVSTVQKQVGEKIAQLDKFAEDRMAAEKKGTIKAELDALVSAGKVLPAEVEGLSRVLAGLDAKTVQKFSEGGKDVERTAFDDMLATLKNRPAIASFAERLKSPAGANGTATDDEAKLKAHYQTFSERFRKIPGMSEQKLIDGYKNAKKIDQDLTVEEFLEV